MTPILEDEVVAVAIADAENDRRRQLALLKAVGLDRVAPEQRELALAIAKRYDLDLLLKHLVLIEGRPYMTRDALLWIAHRSGQFDGIAVTPPKIITEQGGDYWYSEATVWRKDMSHPFVYGGRYPTKGGNQKFAPEMAVKVAESMALRRAFNVSAPSADERWDAEVPAAEPEPPKSLAEKVAEKAAAVTDTNHSAPFEGDVLVTMPVEVSESLPVLPEPDWAIIDTAQEGEDMSHVPPDVQAMAAQISELAHPKARAATTTAKQTTPGTEDEAEQCASISKLSGERCRLAAGNGHMLHRTKDEAWADKDGV